MNFPLRQPDPLGNFADALPATEIEELVHGLIAAGYQKAVTGTRPPPRGRELGLRYSLA